MSSKLYESVQDELYRAFRRDFNTLIEEFDFYQQLSPKMQTEVVQYLFGGFKR